MSDQGYGGPSGPGGFGQPPGGGFGQPPGGGPPGGGPPAGSFGVPPAGHGAAAPPPTGAPGEWSPTGVISEAWERFKENPAGVFLPLFVATMLQNAPSTIGNLISNVLTSADDGDGTMVLIGTGISFLFGMAGFLVGCYLTGGIIRFSLKVMRQEPYSFGDVFSGGDVFLPVLLASMITGAATFFGVLACIVPGAIVALGLSMTLPLIADQGVGPIDALKQSWALTTGHKMNLFVFGLLCMGLALAGLLACCVGILLVGPLITLAGVAIYSKLIGR